MEQVGIQVAACGFDMLVLLGIFHPEAETLCVVVGDQRMMRGEKMCITNLHHKLCHSALHADLEGGHDPGMLYDSS